MYARLFLIFLVLLQNHTLATAQAIRGEVLDVDTHPVKDVHIENIYTSLDVLSGEQGAFLIAAAGGQLLEFRKTGYKTTRVRIPQGYLPPFFRIIISKGITDIKDQYIAENRYNYKKDSLRFYELYKHELEFPKLSGVDGISHPFSALSRKNREIWQFQDTYEEFEKQKYVDMTFNAALITKMTGLKGDSAQSYIRRYKPSYEVLRNMNDYAFYNYIKNTVHNYRSYNTPRGAQ